jgi:diaminopimelate decarboxylase
LLVADASQTKKKIRDRIRQLEDGEVEWQKCQALLYGPRIGEARLIDGVPRFFELCRTRGVKVYIVSHKTEFSRYDTTGTNLRAAALEWMTAHGFFESNRLGLTAGDIFFAGTRQEKIGRIAELRCTDFIDDLEETFLEEGFPAKTARILYEPGRESPAPAGVAWMQSWREISEYFFGSS